MSHRSHAELSRVPSLRPGVPPVWLVLLAALAVRVGYWQDVAAHPLRGWPYSTTTVAGQPLWDASSYDQAAEEFSQGRRIDGHLGGRRPLWPMLLGAVYLWAGPNVQFAYAINVLAGATTVALVYGWLLRRAGPVVALAVAVSQTFWPCNLATGFSCMTEPLGSLLFAAALILLAEGALDGRLGRLAAAGALFALANMTRTATLLNLPLDAAWLLLFGRAAGRRWSAALKGAAVYAAAAVAALLPFAAYHWQRTGGIGVSDASNLLYCATSPEYGQFNWRADHEANRLGLHHPRERYAYFMGQVRENLRQHPGLYARRVRDTAGQALVQLSQQTALLKTLFVAVALGAVAAALRAARPATGVVRARAVLAALVCAALAAWAWGTNRQELLGSETWFAPKTFGAGPLAPAAVTGLAAWGSLVALYRWRRAPLVPLVVLAGGGALLIAAVVNFEERFLLPVAWAFEALVMTAAVDLYGRLLGQPAAPADALSPSPVRRHGAAFRLAMAAAAVWALVTGVRLARRQVRPVPLPVRGDLPAATAVALSAAAERGLIDPAPDCGSPAGLAPVFELAQSGNEAQGSSLIVGYGRFKRQRYYFAPGEVSPTAWGPFLHRNYDRTVLLIDAYGDGGQLWLQLPVIVPGDLRTRVDDRPHCVVGRLHRRDTPFGSDLMCEALAIVPLDRGGDSLELSRAIFAETPAHLELVARLRHEHHQRRADAADREASP